LFLIKGERKRERKKKRVNCGVLVSLQRQKFYFSEEEKVKKLLSPFLSSCLFCFSSFGTQPRRRLSSNEQKKGKRE
jgi:hypothetical protein